MKQITNILHTFSLSFLLAGVLVITGLTATANDNLTSDNKDKIKKNENKLSLVAMSGKANLSLDAGFRFNGAMSSNFKLSDDNNSWNFKSVMTIKKGNVTYVLPYATKIQQPSNMNFHQLHIILPLRKN